MATVAQELQGIAFGLKLLRQAYDKVVIDAQQKPPPSGDPTATAALASITADTAALGADTAAVQTAMGGVVGVPPTAPP
jgi:hypothetical protein